MYVIVVCLEEMPLLLMSTVVRRGNRFAKDMTIKDCTNSGYHDVIE